MKKCPSCDKRFEDSMRFCQADGTPLVDDVPPLDPYKTIVARPIDVSASGSENAPSASPSESAAPPASTPIAEPDDLLDLPDADPLKTMYVSEDEMRMAMSGAGSGELQIPTEPEPPRFDQAASSPPESTTPPIPSPFSASPMFTEPEPEAAPEPPRPMFTEPAPSAPPYNEPATVIQDFPPESPFGSSEPSFSEQPEPRYEPAPPPSEPAFKEPEPYRPAVIDTPSPFQQENSPAAWTPPPPPEPSWQNQEIGQNTPFQPPAAGGGVNQTLPIISLVLGIVSLCCYVSPVTGIAALITGYLGLKNIKTDPNNYGGRGLAIAGMITGGVFLLIGLAYWIYIIFVVGFVALGSLGR